MWDLAKRTQVGPPFEGHANSVMSVAFSSDAKYIVSGAHDNTIYVWNVDTSSQWANDNHLNPIGLLSWNSLHHSSLGVPPHFKIRRGWVSCDDLSDLLFWLPSAHRVGFWSPYTKLVISKEQTMLLYEKFVHGANWAECCDIGT
ncbi:hypothetical protein DFH09DRAFT_463913 [Mycena vulgaris]|nr:hypothetical protein DFH09DRAFT_463913 [Mycena vulgaris]